jgi:hypothetical protein
MRDLVDPQISLDYEDVTRRAGRILDGLDRYGSYEKPGTSIRLAVIAPPEKLAEMRGPSSGLERIPPPAVRCRKRHGSIVVSVPRYRVELPPRFNWRGGLGLVPGARMAQYCEHHASLRRNRARVASLSDNVDIGDTGRDCLHLVEPHVGIRGGAITAAAGCDHTAAIADVAICPSRPDRCPQPLLSRPVPSRLPLERPTDTCRAQRATASCRSASTGRWSEPAIRGTRACAGTKSGLDRI